jgi:hypothetical protein
MNDLIDIGGVVCAITVIVTMLIGLAKAKPKAGSAQLATAVKLYKVAVGAATVGLVLELFDWEWSSIADVLTVVATGATVHFAGKRLESARLAERIVAQRAAEEHGLPWVGDAP